MLAIDGVSLGADQLGQLIIEIEARVVQGEKYTAEKVASETGDLQILVVGEQGTDLLATMTDQGWQIDFLEDDEPEYWEQEPRIMENDKWANLPPRT